MAAHMPAHASPQIIMIRGRQKSQHHAKVVHSFMCEGKIVERTEQKLEQWSYLFVICEICNNQANIQKSSFEVVTKITIETNIVTILSSVT